MRAYMLPLSVGRVYSISDHPVNIDVREARRMQEGNTMLNVVV
jgi:hypothetical protein